MDGCDNTAADAVVFRDAAAAACNSDPSCSQPETDRRPVIGPASGTQQRPVCPSCGPEKAMGGISFPVSG